MARLTAPPATRRRPRVRVAGIAAALSVGMIVLPACGGSRAGATTTFRRETVNAPSAGSFVAKVGTDQAGVQPPENASGAYPGTTPGLYSGNADDTSCDRAALAAFLDAKPASAAAWADASGIAPNEIDAYVARLTPVVLRTDTAVTSHGFGHAKATSIPTVFQAGTAVMVNDRGVPVVQCGSGNPLTTAGSTADASYDGASWDGFSPERVTTVKPAPGPMSSVVIADPTGTGVRRPVGTTGSEDTPYVPGDEEAGSVPVSTPSTATTTTLPETLVPGGGGPTSDYPASDRPASDYPLGTGPTTSPVVTTTYIATYALADSADGAGGDVTDDCARAAIFDAPFAITVRISRDAVRAETTVVGSGASNADVAIQSPLPTRDLHDAVSPTGTFSVGGSRTYDSYADQGAFTARWSGDVGGSRAAPAEFPLTIRRTWVRARHFVAWLTSSGGPDDYSCAYAVTAIRQG